MNINLTTDELDEASIAYARLILSDTQKDLVKLKSPTSEFVTESRHDGPPFRLLELPEELQLSVIERYFEGSLLELQATAGGSFVCKTIPSLRLERTCKHIRAICIDLRNEKIERTLFLEASVDIGTLVQQLTTQRKFLWLRNHVITIEFNGLPNFPAVPEWPSLISLIPHLECVNFVSFDPCRIQDASTDLIISSTADDANTLAGMLAEGLLDDILPSLSSVPEIARLCNCFEPAKSGQHSVALFAMVQIQSAHGRPLFVARIQEAMATKGLTLQEKYIYLSNGEGITLKQNAAMPVITDVGGQTKPYDDNPEKRYEAQQAIAQNMLAALDLGPEEFMSMLMVDAGEGGGGVEDDEMALEANAE